MRYAADEAKGKQEKTLDVSDWKQLAPTEIPEQKNGCDCGVFMVKFADWLVRNLAWRHLRSCKLTELLHPGTAGGLVVLTKGHALLSQAHRRGGAHAQAPHAQSARPPDKRPDKRLVRSQVRQQLAQ